MTQQQAKETALHIMQLALDGYKIPDNIKAAGWVALEAIRSGNFKKQEETKLQ